MWTLPKYLSTIIFALTIAASYQAIAGEPDVMVAQSSGGIVGAAPGNQIDAATKLNPEQCRRCYQQLQKDNHDCESLKGQDWTICREAANTAYRQCSQGC